MRYYTMINQILMGAENGKENKIKIWVGVPSLKKKFVLFIIIIIKADKYFFLSVCHMSLWSPKFNLFAFPQTKTKTSSLSNTKQNICILFSGDIPATLRLMEQFNIY